MADRIPQARDLLVRVPLRHHRPPRIWFRRMTRRDGLALGLPAFVGALIGAALVTPVGQLMYDGPPSCGDRCTYTSTTLLIGLHIHGTYPLWLRGSIRRAASLSLRAVHVQQSGVLPRTAHAREDAAIGLGRLAPDAVPTLCLHGQTNMVTSGRCLRRYGDALGSLPPRPRHPPTHRELLPSQEPITPK